MKINRWNYKTHKYDECKIPEDWNCRTYCNNMDEIVNCPHCGKKKMFGDCYTSLEFHTDMGMGYAVCEECYQLEWERRKNNETRRDI